MPVQTKKAIVTGSVYTEDKAIEWLKAHGATVETHGVLRIIELPEMAEVARNNYANSKYTISFFGPDGNVASHYVEVEQNIDAYETRLWLCH